MRYKLILPGVLLLIISTACTSNTITFDESSNSKKSPQVKTGASIQICLKEIIDERSEKTSLGPGKIVSEDAISTLVKRYLVENVSAKYYLDTTAECSSDYSLSVRILKAYIHHVSTSMEGVVVIKTELRDRSGNIIVSNAHRGQEVDHNIMGASSEFKTVIERASSSAVLQALNDLNGI